MGYKEIGSEFWEADFVAKNSRLFGENVKWLMSGRSALAYCLEDICTLYDVKSAELPMWCCESMIVPFLKAGLEVHFYPITMKDGGITATPSYRFDIVLIMDYFGFSCKIEGENPKQSSIVIRDITHSVFSQKHSDADYYFGSARKWTGIITGGYAAKDGEWKAEINIRNLQTRYVECRKKAMSEKEKYILGMKKEKDYLKLFSDAEQILDRDFLPRPALEEDVAKCKKIDVDFIVHSRRKNAGYIYDNLDADFVFKTVGEHDCPMFVPILVKDRDKFRSFMTEHNIYLPVHWPRCEQHILNDEAEYIYNNCISLICDQRYNEDDMKKQVQVIEEWINRQKEE